MNIVIETLLARCDGHINFAGAEAKLFRGRVLTVFGVHTLRSHVSWRYTGLKPRCLAILVGLLS